MYEKVECVMIVCDNCKDTFECPHDGFSIFVDESQADEKIDNHNWYSDYDKHYCPDCYELDDDDELIVKLKKVL